MLPELRNLPFPGLEHRCLKLSVNIFPSVAHAAEAAAAARKAAEVAGACSHYHCWN